MKVETNVNVTSLGDSDDVSRDAVEACATRLNDTLQQVQLLDRILADRLSASGDRGGLLRRRPLTVIGATADCVEARMTPAGFLYLTSGWKCPRHLVLDRQRWRCTSRPYMHQPPAVLSLSTILYFVTVDDSHY